jgi:branched-chain amino acid transport system permease protein
MDGSISIISQVIFWGLYAGCIYILLATGLNLIFGVMKVVNFAHGEFLMLGTYITFSLFLLSGFNPYVLLFASLPLLIVVGVITERLCFRPILGSGKLNEIFVSLGLIYIFQNIVAMIWTDEWKTLESPFRNILIDIGLVQIPLDYIIIIITTAIILLLLHVFLHKTTLGKAIRATSQNRNGAMLMGVNVERMDMITFGIGAGLAGAAGTMWAVSGQVFNPYMGSIPAIKAFAIIILGGLGSIPGAIIGGLAIGLGENITAYTLGGSWKDAVSFVILIIVLVIRPTGLFGEAEE